MRLFVAIRFSPAVKGTLQGALAALRRQGAGVFTRPENLHLTLAFLGETAQVDAACAAVEAVCRGRGAFPLAIEGLGQFGDLWWAGIEENPRLARLALEVQEALGAGGFSIQRRPWRPHVTLVRQWRGPRPALSVPRTEMEVWRVSLMASDRVEGKLVYTEVFGVEL